MFDTIEHTNDKKHLRRLLRQRRQSLSLQTRYQSERKINNHLKSLIKKGKNIAVYVSVGSELRLDNFIQTAKKRKAKIYVPYIEQGKRRLWFTPLPCHFSGSLKQKNSHQNKKSTMLIPQFQGKKIRAHQLQTLIIPIIGIDSIGYRLGQGGGYYDCTLAHCRNRLTPRLIATSFSCQTVAQLPTEAHDAQIKEWFGEQGRIKLPLIID